MVSGGCLMNLIALVALAVAVAPEKSTDPLAEARERLQQGNIAEARSAYERNAKEDKLAGVAGRGMAGCWRGEGENSRALAALAAALKATPADPDLRAHRADLLFSLGHWDDALKDAEAVRAKDERHFLARWVRARILRDKGDHAAADKEVRWFVRAYSD